MANSDDELLEPIKFIRGSMQRRVELPEEIRQARESPAFWWFQCLMVSDEYRYCCEHGGKGELAETYEKFGNIFSYSHFDLWWRKHGRYLFIQQKKINVRIIDEATFRRSDIEGDKLILEVPLSLRKKTAMLKIGAILKGVYEGREVNIQKNSTAQVKFVKSKIRMSTVELLLKIHKLRERYPGITLNQIGLRAGIELEFGVRTQNASDVDSSDYERTRRMTIVVSRYLKQARHLIHNAEKGIFPCINKLN